MEQIDSQLHTAWLSQLSREYENICYQYNIGLPRPILTISRSKKQLGSWSAGDRTITLSHYLISAHPWSLTLQVLKHEMAHQVCSELYGRDDVGHGSIFRDACQHLGLDAPFHRASADLEEGITSLADGSTATEPGRLIIDKVRKLLALGGSDNEHEAALAVQRAGELLARYRLDFDALAEDQGLMHRTINTGGRNLPVHRKSLCSILQTSFGVRVICSSIYDPQADCSFKTIELLGREEEVAIAEHCYHFLENRLQSLWERNRRNFIGNGRMARKSYFLGLLTGFRETLKRSHPSPVVAGHRTPATPPATLLPIIAQEQRLEDFVAFRFPRLRQARQQKNSIHRDAYNQALADGRKITLHRPVEDGGSEKIRLLS